MNAQDIAQGKDSIIRAAVHCEAYARAASECPSPLDALRLRDSAAEWSRVAFRVVAGMKSRDGAA